MYGTGVLLGAIAPPVDCKNGACFCTFFVGRYQSPVLGGGGLVMLLTLLANTIGTGQNLARYSLG